MLSLAYIHQKTLSQGPSSSRRSPPIPLPTAPSVPSSAPSQQLLRALLAYPMFLPPLVAKLRDAGAAKESKWTDLLQRQLFAEQSDQQASAALHTLKRVYSERHHLLWKIPAMQTWLYDTALRAAGITDGESVGPGLEPESAHVWARVREAQFGGEEGMARSAVEHLRVADFSDNVAAIPEQEAQQLMQQQEGAGAMLDEEMLEQLAAMQAVQGQPGAVRGGGTQMSDEEVTQMGAWGAFLRSLFPWVNAGQAPEYGESEDEQGARDD